MWARQKKFEIIFCSSDQTEEEWSKRTAVRVLHYSLDDSLNRRVVEARDKSEGQ